MLVHARRDLINGVRDIDSCIAGLCGGAVAVLLQLGDNWVLYRATEQLRPGDLAGAARRLLEAPALEAAGLTYIDGCGRQPDKECP